MDYSGKYLMMCQKAIQLQKDIKDVLPVPFGAMYLTLPKKINFLRENKADHIIQNDDCYWIPRLDELFDTLKLKGKSFVTRFMISFDDKVTFPALETLPTMEQMGLCIVMAERYSKEWSEEEADWVDLRMYGIGTKDKKGGWGMVAGPTRSLEELLNLPVSSDMLKDERDWFIIGLIRNVPIYKWSVENDAWITIDNG